MQPSRSAFVGLVLLLLPVPQATACTTFCLKRGPQAVFGKNYDWAVGDGLVIVNKSGVSKTAAIPPQEKRSPQEKPARWVSRYGSLTFNQYGREFPNGGMNEAGLAVELMWLDETRYTAPDGRHALGCLEWIQYQLDNYATVDEVVKNAGRLRVTSDAKVHYLACDKSGSCATFEILNGRPVIHSGASLPVRALANHTYEDSLRFREKGQGSQRGGTGSLQRFARAAERAEAYAAAPEAADPVRYAFETLDSVAQGSYTRWSIVYDLKAGRVHWLTRENRKVRFVTLSSFDWSCSTPVEVLGIDEGEGDVTRRFVRYTPEANRKLVAASVGQTDFLKGILPPEALLEAIAETASHPESTACVAGHRRRP
jgi:penicillin V acylase-like amidase (Ntn superfamily)